MSSHGAPFACGVFTLHFQKLASGLSVENPLLPTILSSLKEVAKIDAEVFEVDVDSVIKEFAVKKVLRRDETVSDTMDDTFNESFVRIQTIRTGRMQTQ